MLMLLIMKMKMKQLMMLMLMLKTYHVCKISTIKPFSALYPNRAVSQFLQSFYKNCVSLSLLPKLHRSQKPRLKPVSRPRRYQRSQTFSLYQHCHRPCRQCHRLHQPMSRPVRCRDHKHFSSRPFYPSPLADAGQESSPP